MNQFLNTYLGYLFLIMINIHHNNYLESCKFCGTDWKHYCKDSYAINQIKAETNFTAAHTDAVVWECPYDVAFPEDNTPPAGGAESDGGEHSAPDGTRYRWH